MDIDPRESPIRKTVRVFLRNKTSMVRLVLILVIIGMAVFAPFLSPYDVREQDLSSRFLKPGLHHWLGTDDYGRDTFSRAVFGARTSLIVGVVSVFIAIIFGMGVGMVAAYFGGKLDAAVVGMVDILMAFPTILLSLTLLFILGPGLQTLVTAIAFSFFPRFVRITRASTLSVKEEKYVEAARLVGRGDLGILFLHILPNISGPVIVIGTLWIATAIRIEASLSFLGFGINPPTPTWGNMIRTGVTFLQMSPWLVIVPGLAIMITVIAFNLLGDGLRDISDPRLRE